jgi:hypothetical protein
MDERSDDLTLQAFLFTLASDFLHALKSCYVGLWLCFPYNGRCVEDILLPLKVHRFGRV